MRVLGHDIHGDRAAALARVGAIIEEPRFHRHLTGRENLRVNAAARQVAVEARLFDDRADTREGGGAVAAGCRGRARASCRRVGSARPSGGR